MINKQLKSAGFIGSLLLIMLTGIQCSLKNPVAPSWEADINIPLLKSNTYISDFLGLKNSGPGSKDSAWPVMLGTTSIAGDIKKVDVSAVKGMINNGAISYDLENRLAIGLDTAIIYISRDSATVCLEPELIIGPYSIEAAEVDSVGKVIQSRSTHIDIILGEKEMELLSNQSGAIYVKYYLVTNGTNGRTVMIQPEDYLRTSVLVSVRTKIN